MLPLAVLARLLILSGPAAWRDLHRMNTSRFSYSKAFTGHALSLGGTDQPQFWRGLVNTICPVSEKIVLSLMIQ